ncbi:MAG: alpha/beta fold hydrolase [Nitriliruptorales bacterium]|nr:alpha/beta fold hydrolase [Nitriliruptorales bacterium]
MDVREVSLHGHRIVYRTAGEGPPLLLVHGITSSAATWKDVIPTLARDHTVIAPDLLGHGQSAKPLGDYSLGAYASGIRDLLGMLGVESATVVGHSLGGGVAMQFAYLFPDRCNRLVLVASGGLGREVNMLLRAAALPGAEFVLPLICAAPIRDAGNAVGRVMEKVRVRPTTDIREMWRGFTSLGSTEARRAFLHTLRTIVDVGGQRVSATDRLYLAQHLPTMIVWGAKDPVIPATHGVAAAAAIPGSRFELFEKSGHFPHRDEPARFTRVLRDFLARTEPAALPEDVWRETLRLGAAGA